MPATLNATKTSRVIALRDAGHRMDRLTVGDSVMAIDADSRNSDTLFSAGSEHAFQALWKQAEELLKGAK